ncbi:hypothetical protein A2344_00800 [Candidatus Peregrinibacteria bacterium RIFOXYB12_FULL_41_12]|nr:MAG: hypothetical protein A2244_01560 [Candidatus Peregrinibacteria bacterium RIFOXYA2_FULL_41_18]OGJ49054.1 MAG: hypothetical protein A2344_00800 [Candidatus Peregrinibacteria bacterium RIFOXYB12_FULL_41_12]OGJ52417.1 MAG: hypothetical protein A2336_02365 [Candidatus Peregrinibacteria bacterium RIFOXYB2_FULL_41_88]OGJ53421.1 MAG: hypothetical protein A2448_01905 [Candidatus Peregrinibacteria bacterium RIFOXYC2_FULL_41_22]
MHYNNNLKKHHMKHGMVWEDIKDPMEIARYRTLDLAAPAKTGRKGRPLQWEHPTRREVNERLKAVMSLLNER